MQPPAEVVITGLGLISPIGIGREAFWQSLSEGRSGVSRLSQFEMVNEIPPFGGQIRDFDPKLYVRPRKSLKVMCRDIQLAVAAAELAWTDAHLPAQPPNPDRFGVVLGAEMIQCEPEELAPAFEACIQDGRFEFRHWGQRAIPEIFPLWMLKYLPNMPACHVGIIRDARGPTNTIVLGEVSSLVAIGEAFRTIQRGAADLMLAGGASSRIHPVLYVRSPLWEVSRRAHQPEAACRPFDLERDGLVHGEGAAVFVLESAAHAHARAAPVRARILSYAEAFEPRPKRGLPTGQAIEKAILLALKRAGVTPSALSHVNAHGMSTRHDDRIEAQAIYRTLPQVPVTAPKSYFGYLGAGSAAVELAASLLALEYRLIPPTLNYQKPDPECPVQVVAEMPRPLGPPVVVKLSHAWTGQAAALVLASL
ncbi:MAG: beta-ketoacyl-[acyl-carrier-protein] synthase family protein [Thermoguttaceae bacterium]|nr:beta-ketoacyl-[acyl-carrier-protein] synthase family protein [Thermoguttaceae bacterium]MDW8037348.1 beta-ketoacyl-[acyl-carrier-protein] synthase family protein [Thermoguttaceae bacterium]